MCISLYCCARFSLKVSAAPFTVPTPQMLTNFPRSHSSLSPLLSQISLFHHDDDNILIDCDEVVSNLCDLRVQTTLRLPASFKQRSCYVAAKEYPLILSALLIYTEPNKASLMLPQHVISDGNLESEV